MIALSQLSMRFGEKILFTDVSLQFNPGSHYGLIGANGCGKSTLIKILTKEITSEKGGVVFPQQLTLGFLCQDQYLYDNELILSIVLRGKKKLWEALEKKKILLEKESFNDQDCKVLTQLEKIIEEQEGYSAEGEAAKLLEGLGIREEWHQKPLQLLSGGYKLRVLLAQVLFGKPDILILDEPTNHLDLYSIKWLADYLRNFPGTLVVTSHDREFLNEICTHIADVDYGTIKLYKGNYDAFLEQKSVDRELKQNLLEKHDKRRAQLQGFIDRFGAKASKARQAQSKAKMVEQIEEQMGNLNLLPSSRIYPTIYFEALRASGVKVLTIQAICKAYGSKKVLDHVSFEIERGEKVAIIGPNGIGKSTLLEILMQHKIADQGSFNWGFATRLAYFPQDYTQEMQGGESLIDWLSQFDPEASQECLRDLLGLLLFSGDRVHQSIQTLSGGEKARLILARMMLQKPNVLIFDEPTNHLDMEAIEELIKALESFEGTLLFVSHNRYFVSHLATRIIEISYQGVKDFKETYAGYLEKQGHDHLNVRPALNQRYLHETTPQPASSTHYEDYKKLKSRKAQLRKKVEQTEERCHQIELKIQEIDSLMASEGFYAQTSREKQQEAILQKNQLEIQLLEAMEQWELVGLELQKYEEE